MNRTIKSRLNSYLDLDEMEPKTPVMKYKITTIIIILLILITSCSRSRREQDINLKIPAIPTHSIAIIKNTSTPKESTDKVDKLIEETRNLIIKGDLKGATESINRAIEMDPQCAEAYLLRGFIREKLIEWDDALSDYQKARQLDPGNPEAYACLGLLQIVKRGMLKKATQNFNKALEIEPGNRTAVMGLGMIYMFKEDYTNAKKYFDEVLKKIPNPDSPENAILFEERGYADCYLRNYRAAIRDFDKAIEIDPKNLRMSRNYVGLAMCYFRMGKMDKAIEYLDKIQNTDEIIAIHTEYDTINQLLSYHGRLDTSLAVSMSAHRAFPGMFIHIRQYARMLDNFGKLDDAREMYETARKLNSTSTDIHIDIGNFNMAWGEAEEAEKYFKKAMEIGEDDDIDPHISYAVFLMNMKRYDEAEKILKEGIEIGKNADKPELSSVFLYLSDLYLRTDEKEKAKTYLEKAIKTDPVHSRIDNHVADMYLKEGDYKKAIDRLDDANLKNIAMEDLVFDIGSRKIKLSEVYFAMGEHEKGMKQLKKAFKGAYPARRQLWIKYTIPRSPYFKKAMSKDDFKEFIKEEEENIFNHP
ncbi:MAG: tetratricopeptide repeat protein [Candidatus Eremiobacteraeota bacterium]|nr:tetratricopeptide repeat protein [Candidatus Eremiobacteraeota bacterium]